MIMNMTYGGGAKQEFGFTYTGDYTDRLITYNSETYRLLTFTSSGTFTPNQSFVGDVWLCGGGGNGAKSGALGGNNVGTSYSGGGGGGGYINSINSNIFSSQGYQIVVGAAGEASSVLGYVANPGESAMRDGGGDGGSGGGHGWANINPNDVGLGDGTSTIPFGDSANFTPHCGGGGGGAAYIVFSSSTKINSGGDGGSDGSDGFDGEAVGGSGAPGSGGNEGGGAGGDDSSSTSSDARDGQNATHYGGGGGGGGIYASSKSDNYKYGNGGVGYQGVVYVRIKQQ